MILFDGHLDLGLNALAWNRDLKKSALEIRLDEAGMTEKGRGRGTIGLPDLRDANLAVCFVTVLARVKPRESEADVLNYRTHESAYAHAQGELAYYREMERQGYMRIISDLPALDAHMAQWRANSATCPLGVVLTMEGADPIVDPESVQGWWDQGLRVASLVHYGTSKYAYGTGVSGPVTPDGLLLLDEMAKTKMILDVTHLCDESFWMAVDRFPGPLVATHSNNRTMVPDDRQFSDDQLKLLIERDAVVGIALDAWMLIAGWVRGVTQPDHVTLETYVNHIDHLCWLSGNTRHAAIGTDLDGGYGTEQTPRDLDTYADLQRVPEILAKRGYTDDDIAAICHGNWLRKLADVWGDA